MNVPKHVAIIMDGNGRWATNRGLKRSMGHLEGSKTLEKLAIPKFDSCYLKISRKARKNLVFYLFCN